MADRLANSALSHTLSNVIGDLVDLLQKEIKLARTEISEKLTLKIRAGVWMGAAGVFGLMTAFLLLQAVVFALAAYGIALHWACVIVAAGCAAVATGAFAKGKSDASEDLAPTTTLRNVRQDISTAKEQLS
jgi:hypothetical protein